MFLARPDHIGGREIGTSVPYAVGTPQRVHASKPLPVRSPGVSKSGGRRNSGVNID